MKIAAFIVCVCLMGSSSAMQDANSEASVDQTTATIGAAVVGAVATTTALFKWLKDSVGLSDDAAQTAVDKLANDCEIQSMEDLRLIADADMWGDIPLGLSTKAKMKIALTKRAKVHTFTMNIA